MPSDSTGVESPCPHPLADSNPTTRKPSILQKLKLKQSPPIAFENQTQSRVHKRSSSFSGFVSRILPSHREEKGHALRQKYEDNGTQDPVGLVFGVSGSQDPNVRLSSEIHDGGIARKTRSWSPSKTNAPSGLRQSDWERSRNGHSVGQHTESQGMGPDGGAVLQAHARAIGSWGGLLGLMNETKGENQHLYQQSKEQGESQVPLLSGDIPELENSEMTKTQKMFEDKKARREQRRSLRESGDFLGVQGANPRTGYWDVSSGTSSSEPSQKSEETKKKLDEEAKNIEEQKQRYEEAKAKHQAELARVQSLRDNKKREKEKRKRMELKMKQRRHGKWKLSEDGWRSVAEPELSPIVQSVVGSPARETAPADRLFPMPSAADPTPYVNPNNIEPHDYFGHRMVSSPLASERSRAPSHERSAVIPRKPVGSPIHRRTDQTSDTVIHTGSIADSMRIDHHLGDPAQLPNFRKEHPRVGLKFDTQPSKTTILESVSPSQNFGSFLDETLDPSGSENQEGREVTATSSQSVSTSQAEILQPSDQSPKATSPEKRYTSLKDFPPVILRDPYTTRVLSSSQPILPLTIWVSPTILDSPVPHITTPIITTTGSAHLQPLHVQFDSLKDDASDAQARRPSPQRKSSQIPLRTTSLQDSNPHAAQSTGSQATPADIATSSEHLLPQKKWRIARLCHANSPGGNKVVMKSTHIFTSTFPQTPSACMAALTDFQNLKHRVAMKKAKGQDREDSLTPPKIRRSRVETKGPRVRAVLGGHADTGDPFMTRMKDAHPYLRQGRLSSAKRAGVPDGGWEDGLVVWYPSPSAENRGPGDMAGPFATRLEDADLYLRQRRLSNAARAELPDDRWEDGPVVWHPSPNAENRRPVSVDRFFEVREPVNLPRSLRGAGVSPTRKPTFEEKAGIVRLSPAESSSGSSPVRVRGTPCSVRTSPYGVRAGSGITGQSDSPRPKAEDMKIVRFEGKKGASPDKRATPKSASPRRPFLQDISRIAFRMFQTAWWFVEPVFDPKSDVRARWERGHRLTLRDIVLFVAASVFMAAVLLIAILFFRVVITGLQIVRAFWNVFRILTAF